MRMMSRHLPMSLNRDVDCCCHINGIFAILSCLFLTFFPSSCFRCCALAAIVLCAFCILLPCPHRFAVVGSVWHVHVWACVLPCKHWFPLNVAFQTELQITTLPTRQKYLVANKRWSRHDDRQKTKSRGFNTLANIVELSWGSKSVREYVLDVEVRLLGLIPQMKPLYCGSLFGDCIERLRRGCLSCIPTSCHKQHSPGPKKLNW